MKICIKNKSEYFCKACDEIVLVSEKLEHEKKQHNKFFCNFCNYIGHINELDEDNCKLTELMNINTNIIKKDKLNIKLKKAREENLKKIDWQKRVCLVWLGL